MPLGVPPLPIKGTPLLLSEHTSSWKISLPPLEFPHGLGSVRYMFPMAFSGRICCFRYFAGTRAWRLSGYPDVCAITDTPLLCGAGLDGAGPAGPDGLHHDLETGKRSSTSSTSITSLTLFSLWWYVFYGCISTCFLYLIDRSWYIVVPIVGNFLFSMLRTLHFERLRVSIYLNWRWSLTFFGFDHFVFANRE